MKTRISLREVPRYVRERRIFNANGTLFSELDSDGVYTVYSYGYHWPLAVIVPGFCQLLNVTPSSVTTGKHRSYVARGIDGPSQVTREFLGRGSVIRAIRERDKTALARALENQTTYGG